MVCQSIAIATRQKHLRTLLGLSRLLEKDWKDITKKDVEKLVYEIMLKHGDESGKETHYSYDHKKVLKIFVRWMKLGSREFSEVGDPPETIKVRMKRVKDKIVREDLLTEDDVSRLLHVCGENSRDRALIDCHYEGGTRPGEILSILIKHVKFEDKVANIVNDTKGLAICGYPIRDLDRLLSFYESAKKSNRDLVIDMKQAYLLKLFHQSDNLRGHYPSPTDSNIKIYIQRGTWGLLDKDLEKFSDRQFQMDYSEWQREFLDYPNAVDYRDIQKNQKNFIFFCSDFRLQDLIDIKPGEGATYIRSLTEPFDLEMELKEEQIKNWFTHFGVIKKDQDWHQIHVSGHGDGEQIKRVIEGSNSKKLIPIHTQHDEYHKKWHGNVLSVNQHDSVTI